MAGHTTLSEDLDFHGNQDNTNDMTIIIIFDTLLIIGLISVLAVLFTALFSRKLYRSATWYSFTSSWVLYCLAFLILLGNQQGSGPPNALCALQASLIYPVTVLTAFSILALLIQLYQMLVSSIYRQYPGRYWVYILVCAPWWMALVVLAICVSHSIVEPNSVGRQDTGMFCHFSDRLMVKITTYLLVFDTAGIFICQAMIITLVYKNWRVIQKVQSLPMIMRISVFSLLPLVPLILNLVAMGTHNMFVDNLSNILAAAVPLGAGIIFSTSPDVLSVWRFWKRSESETETSSATDDEVGITREGK